MSGLGAKFCHWPDWVIREKARLFALVSCGPHLAHDARDETKIMITKFEDRRQAGRVLGFLLAEYRKISGGVVLALSRCGVPVAYEVARALSLPLDAVDVNAARAAVPASDTLRDVALRLTGRCVILVDDGLLAAEPVRAVIAALRETSEQIVVAVPVASPEACAEVSNLADKAICAASPKSLRAVGESYRRHEETTTEEARTLLFRAYALRTPVPSLHVDAVAHG